MHKSTIVVRCGHMHQASRWYNPHQISYRSHHPSWGGNKWIMQRTHCTISYLTLIMVYTHDAYCIIHAVYLTACEWENLLCYHATAKSTHLYEKLRDVSLELIYTWGKKDDNGIINNNLNDYYYYYYASKH